MKIYIVKLFIIQPPPPPPSLAPNITAYPKVSGLSRQRNKQQQTLVEKQTKGLWRQHSLYWLIK